MKVLVLGGTGLVGRELVRRLTAEGHEVAFTWFRDQAGADALPGRGLRVDLGERGAAKALFKTLRDELFNIEGFAHCARLRPEQQGDADEAELMERTLRLSAEATRLGVRALAEGSTGEIRNAVLCCAWSPGQSLPMAAPLAAAQGALVTLAMSLGRELAGSGVRVNGLALGLLEGGAAEAVSPEQTETYTRLSALHRVGTAAEVAATICWLLRENRIMNGRVLASNGGI